MDPKQLMIPVEGGCDSNGFLEMVNCLVSIALGSMYPAENMVRLAGLILIAFLRDETDCA